MKSNLVSDLKCKKTKEVIFTLAYAILQELRYGVTSLAEIVKITGERKQNVEYWLQRFCDEDLAYQPGRGYYKITDMGKDIHDEYERLRKKQCIRIENTRISYSVYEGLDNLKTKLVWSPHKINNGVEIYHTHVNKHLVRLIIGKYKHPTLEISCTHGFDVSPYDAYYDARMIVEKIAEDFVYKFGVRLSKGHTSTKPELAVPTPLAEALLQTHGASQIRTSKGLINRSKGRGADLESMSLQQAQRVVNMPDYVEEIAEKVTFLWDKVDLIANQLQEISNYQRNPFGHGKFN